MADVPSEPSDFFPLFVNYQERFSAAGRTRCVLHFCFPFHSYFICFMKEYFFLHLMFVIFLVVGFSNEKGGQKIMRYLALTFE